MIYRENLLKGRKTDSRTMQSGKMSKKKKRKNVQIIFPETAAMILKDTPWKKSYDHPR